MLLAGTIAASALPLTASALISGDMEWYTADSNGAVHRQSGELSKFISELTDKQKSDSSVWLANVEQVGGSAKLYGYKGSELENGLNGFNNAAEEYKIVYASDCFQSVYALTDSSADKDTIVSAFRTAKSSNSQTVLINEFPFDVKKYVDDHDIIDPLHEYGGWQLWAGADSGFSSNDSATGLVTDSDEITADTVKDAINNNNNADHIYMGLQIISKEKQFTIPYYSVFDNPDGDYITLSESDHGTLKTTRDYYLAYVGDDGRLESYDSFKEVSSADDIWDFISDRLNNNKEFDPGKARLLDNTTFYVYDPYGNRNGSEYCSEYRYNISNHSTTMYLDSNMGSDDLWIVSDTADRRDAVWATGDKLEGIVTKFLDDHPGVSEFDLRLAPDVRVTSEPQTAGAIDYPPDGEDFTYTSLPVTVEELSKVLTLEKGKMFDYDNWKLFTAPYDNGYTLNDITPTTKEISLDTITGFEKGSLVAVIPQVDIPDELVPEVSFDVDKPEFGKTPDTTAEIPADAGYEVSDVSWFTGDDTSNTVTTFGLGEEYSVTAKITARDGYVFDADTDVVVNREGAATVTSFDPKELVVTYNFGEIEPGKLPQNLGFTIQHPRGGEEPNYNVTKDSEDCDVAVTWSKSESALNAAQDSIGKYVEGEKYTARFTVTPRPGYVFDPNTVITLNGETVQHTSDNGALVFSYEFTALSGQAKEITSATVTATAPASGAMPDNTASVAEEGCEVTEVTWNTAEAFKAGEKYAVTVKLTAKDGYAFASGVTAAVNGKTAQAQLENGVLTVTYEFTALSGQAKEITSASVTVTAPASGAMPANTASVAEEGCEVTEVTWNTAEAFKAGEKYAVTVKLTAKDGYAFASGVTAAVNGKTAQAQLENGVLTVTYEFPALSSDEKQEIAHADIKVTAPAKGEKPVKKATVSADGCKVVSVSWSPNEEFKENGRYTVTVELTALDGYKFANGATASINGREAASSNTDDTLIAVYRFPQIYTGDSGSSSTGSSIKEYPIKLAKTAKSEGWSKITEEIKNTADGSTINVILNDETTMPADALQAAIDKKIRLIMDAGFGRVWDINGADAVPGTYIDLSISGVNVDIPEEAYKDISCAEFRKLQINARLLDFTAHLSVYTDEKLAGQNAAVYCYNEETGMMVFQSITMVDGSGNVTFGLRHGGKYFIALGKDVKAPTFLCGDVDGNGVVNALDASAILKYAVYGYPLDTRCGDTNSDGSVNAYDALPILRYVVGEVSTLPVNG